MIIRLVSALAAACLLVVPTGAQTTFGVDAEGFIRNCLVLAPIPMSGQSGAEEIHQDLFRGEAALKPRPEQEVRLNGGTLKWQAHQAPAYYVDFRESFDPNNGEYVIGYAVTYVHADEPVNLTLALGTNDQGKVWLNGKDVLTYEEARVLERDADKVPVSLVKGQNVLVMKVINELNSWQACARFLNGTTPVTNLKISINPQ